ncbi:MAG: hypothetical protein IPN87_11295 [Saprospiraceae bacterium]|nr:hypothetical protein [Candidatus Brachybacter algidus]
MWSFMTAKSSPGLTNTLFILVVDHSHESQIVQLCREDKDRYKLYCFYGPEAIKRHTEE